MENIFSNQRNVIKQKQIYFLKKREKQFQMIYEDEKGCCLLLVNKRGQ